MALAIKSESDRLIPLAGGPAVPLTVIAVLIDLQHRGIDVHLQPDGKIFVGPKSIVDAADLDFIQQHRDCFVAALSYIEQQERRPQ